MSHMVRKIVKEFRVKECGDFNIDLLKINEVRKHRKFYELMSSYGLLPHILNPTRENWRFC